MIACIQYPSWLHPEIIPGLPVRWYGFMYLVAFVIAFFLLRHQMSEHGIKPANDEAMNLITWGIIGLLLGAQNTLLDSNSFLLLLLLLSRFSRVRLCATP